MSYFKFTRDIIVSDFGLRVSSSGTRKLCDEAFMLALSKLQLSLSWSLLSASTGADFGKVLSLCGAKASPELVRAFALTLAFRLSAEALHSGLELKLIL